jgi:type VI secretion system secreted protein VgrG
MDTALGADVLGVRSISIQEQISRLFQIEAELSSENAEVVFDQVVGNNATIRLQIGQKETRYFNGYVSRFVQVANQGGYAHYRATLVPWLWFLTRTADCRIFQDKTIPEIIEEVFKGHGFNDYQINLSATYVKWDYCVQYRETDFNFVSRLMEQEGIYYFFQHEDGKHTLVLADSISAHNPFPGYDEITFHELEKGAPGREVITDWVMEKEVQPGAYALNDFDFEKPKASLLASASVTRQHGAASFEIYDYPGEYVEQSVGDQLAQARLDELQTQHEVLRGQASARGLAAGCTFTLKGHPRQNQNREYLITGVSLQAEAGEYASSGAGQGGGEFFSCSFTAMDKAQQFRPARLTPKPVVQGPQTAIVVGKSGEEIYTDKYGRVKVIFPWDRYSKADENSSCWIRVAQAWAGKKWGAIYTPRIGQEVIVEFLEGDPDQPIITGRVYNADAMPPYDLPGKATISTLKSNSSKGGQGFNEIRFEDKKGEEELFIHAEKDQQIRVKNDCVETIMHDRHLIVENDQFEQVKNERNEKVDKSHFEEIGKDRNLTVKGKEVKEVQRKLSLTVQGDVEEEFQKSHSEKVTNNYKLEAKQVTIEATSKIELKVGGSSITIEASKIELKAPQVAVNGDAKVEIQGGAMVKIQGGMVQIN